jgi:hypothetical protein
MYPKSLEPLSLPKDLDPCMFPLVARTMSVARQQNKIILHPVYYYCFPMYPKSLEPLSLPKALDPCMFPSVARMMSVAPATKQSHSSSSILAKLAKVTLWSSPYYLLITPICKNL